MQPTKRDLSNPTNSHAGLHLTIVGAGPSGLSALEAFCAALAKVDQAQNARVTIVNANAHWGSGPNFASDQSDTNWLNVASRLLTFDARPAMAPWGIDVPPFPAYAEWAAINPSPAIDDYPPRAKLGRYLEARYARLAGALRSSQAFAELEAVITDIESTEGSYRLCDANRELLTCTDVVLCIGHQPTDAPNVFEQWSNHAHLADSSHVPRQFLANAYPTEQITTSSLITADAVVAIRGLGLAMIDVVRALTEARGGAFTVNDPARQTLIYASGKSEPSRITPFSLDGLPPVPKPLNQALDRHYEPLAADRQFFRRACQTLANDSTANDAADQLIQIMADQLERWRKQTHAQSAQVWETNVQNLAEDWLRDSSTTHSLIVDPQIGTTQMMNLFCEMATGQQSGSVDYCMGQLWRKLQPDLYECLSYSVLPADAIAAVTTLDERMKRYAFGPPVASLRRLTALAETGLLSFAVVDDPDIELVDTGWRLSADEDSAIANVMINSVLDAPMLKGMCAPLPRSLLNRNTLDPIHSDLGARTREDGVVLDADDNAVTGLSILGRLAKGTLVGTDAIKECFGERPTVWADGLMARWREPTPNPSSPAET